MGYRFLKIQATGDSYIQSFCREHAEFKSLSYDRLFDLFLKKCIGWNTYYTPGLVNLGYEATDICIDFEFLQKLWAKEHGTKYNDRHWLKEIIAAQIHALQPDIIFLDDLYYFDAPFRQFLRDLSPHPLKIVGWRAAPTEDYRLFRDIDLVLSCTPLFVDQLRRHGAKAEMIMHAFEPSILELLPPGGRRDLDFTFIGSFVLRDGFHNERLELVKSLLVSTDLNVWGAIGETRKNSLPGRILRRLTGTYDRPYVGPEAASLYRNFKARFHPPVLALEYFKVLSRTKISLNKHIDCAESYAGNIRLFETTGVGSCLLTDWKENLADMFVPDEEVIAYRSSEECAEKVCYLLENEAELEAIAAAGQRRTLRDHTYQKRAVELDGIICQLMAGAIPREW